MTHSNSCRTVKIPAGIFDGTPNLTIGKYTSPPKARPIYQSSVCSGEAKGFARIFLGIPLYVF
ncbi:MAG: hypothetical protein ACLUKN_00100 [Bacilli bacterium]